MTLMGGLGHATGGSANVLGRDLTGMDGDALAGIRRKKFGGVQIRYSVTSRVYPIRYR